MNLNFNEICRLCLRFCEKYVDLNQTNGAKTLTEELAERIQFCYLIHIDLSEGLPTKVCYECIQVISFFYIAKKNLLISEQLLRDVHNVRKNFKSETKIHKEENVSRSSIIKKESDKQKPKSVFTIDCKTHNIVNDTAVSLTISCEKSASNLKSQKVTSISDNSSKIVTTSFKQNGDFKVNKKKKKFRHHRSLLKQNNEGQKKLCNDPKGKTKSSTANTTEKEASKAALPMEHIVKEIGTVIDTSNILSPDVKRSRKSVDILKF